MSVVYALYHEYENADGDDEVKSLGLFSTHDRAREAIRHLLDKPGFKDHPYGFKIYECELDTRLAWEEGFITANPNDPLPGTEGYDEKGRIIKKRS